MRSFVLLVALVACAPSAAPSHAKSPRVEEPSGDSRTPAQRAAPCRLKRLELVRFSRDGRFLLTAGRTEPKPRRPGEDGSIDAWDLEKGERVFTFHLGTPWQGPVGIGFAPDGRWAVAANDHVVAMWSFADGTTKFSRERIADLGPLRVSHDGTLVAFYGGDASALVLEMPAMTVSYAGKTGAEAGRSMQFSDKDASLVNFARDRVLLHEPRTMKIKAAWRGVAVLSPDDKTLAIFGEDFSGLVDAATGKKLRAFEAPPPEIAKSVSIAYAHDGSHVALDRFGKFPILVWNTATGKKVPSPADDARALLWTSNGRYVNPATAASAAPLIVEEGGRVVQIDPVTRKIARSYQLDGRCDREAMCPFDLSPDLVLLAYPRSDTGTVRIIRLADGASIELGTAIVGGVQRGFARGADGAFDGPASCATNPAKKSPGLLRNFMGR